MRVVGPLAVSAVTLGIAREAFAQNTDLNIYLWVTAHFERVLR